MIEPSGQTVVVLKGYPRLSETFIAQELKALEDLGLALHIVSLRHPTDPTSHPVHREIAAPVSYLPEYLWREPGRVLRGWWASRRRPGYRAARQQFMRDLWRDRTANRLRRFGQACVLAAELPQGTARLYAHFLHTPGSVARYTAQITGLSWSLSAHAKDIWTSPDWEKREKLADAAWTVTCTRSGWEHLRGLAPDPARISLLYHGLDLIRFPAPVSKTCGTSPRDGRSASDPVRLLSVGRAVEKKGYDDLLAALALLPAECAWHLTHIGGGQLSGRLQEEAARLGLADKIAWLGPQPQDRVLEAYRVADCFVLASKQAADGDRDGLPNVLMEAQSQGLACLATDISGIPELIEADRTGLLVAPGDPAALAAALSRLIGAPDLRRTLGEAGETRIRTAFSMTGGIERLAALLAAAPAAAAAAE